MAAVREAAGASAIADARDSAKIQDALYRITEMASAASDLREFYAAMHGVVGELMFANNFYIALYDDETKTLNYPYYVDEVDFDIPDPDAWEPMGTGQARGLTAYVLRTREPQLVTLARFHQLIADGEVEKVGEDGEDWVGVPLIVDGKAIGVVVVQTYEAGQHYSQADVELLTYVGQHIASALSRARAIAETKQRASELAIVNKVGQAIAAQLDPHELIQLVGEQVRVTMNADIAYVAMHDAERATIDFPYYYERGPGARPETIPFGEGWTSRVLTTKEPLLVNSERERDSMDTPALGTPVLSYLGVPIVIGDEAIGVIAVQSTHEEGRFHTADARLMATIAAGVGSAVQNSRLYGETRRLYAEAREYLEQVAKVTDAAVSLEAGDFGSNSLSAVAERSDALGQLARTFQRMAEEVVAREARLRQQVQELRIEIDEARQQAKVAEITSTDYFKDLRSRADDLRRTVRQGDRPEES